MVASAWASAGVNGPTTRSVGGADAGDADVAGGAEGLSRLEHALSASTAAATRLTTPIRELTNRVWSSKKLISSNPGFLFCLPALHYTPIASVEAVFFILSIPSDSGG
jgi:hypothetical protein